MNFKETPQYQRMVQKIYRMSPHQKAILSTAVADRAFAGSAMQSKLKLMEIGANRQYLNERMALSKRGLQQSYGLKQKELGIRKKESRTAEALGIGNIITSGYLAKKRMDMDIDLSKRLSALAGRWK